MAVAQKAIVIDVKKSKMVMKGMSQEQQDLVELLLNKLKQEQINRLQSEEKNEQVVSRMVLTQKQLEQQMRNLSAKGRAATTVGGFSDQIITPIDSVENTMLENGQQDTFAEFVKDYASPTTKR